MENQEQTKHWSQLVAEAWSDESFKQRFISDPRSVLKEHGLEVPASGELRVVENTESVVHLVLPARPAELSDEDLDRAAGGADTSWVCSTTGKCFCS